jgi:ADP-ribose pyrophosphatase YjhB (NUDIX family)
MEKPQVERTKDAAGFVLFDDVGRVLLVRQTYGEKKWHIPGGVQEEGESAWETAIREAKEEINIDIPPSQCSLSGIYFLQHRNAYVFIFKASGWSGTPTPDGKEIDEVRYFYINDLPSPMENFTIERIRDALEPNVVLKNHHIKDYKIV